MPYTLLKVVPLSTLLAKGGGALSVGHLGAFLVLAREEGSKPHSHLFGYGSYPQRLYIICFGFSVLFSLRYYSMSKGV